MVRPTFEEYVKLSAEFTVVPVYREVVADLETPIAAFKKIGKCPAFLLESVSGGEFLGRYSFIGFDPFLTFKAKGRHCVLITETGEDTVNDGSPVDILADVLGRLRGPKLEGLPRFYGGGVGYFGYDIVRHLEKLPRDSAGETALNDCYLIFCRMVLIFDHVRRRLTLVANTRPGREPGAAYDEALAAITDVLESLRTPLAPDWEITPATDAPHVAVNMSKSYFLSAVRRAKEYIKAGHILQVVLSQRFSRPFKGDTFEVYRRLRTINPSPYLFYLTFGDTVVAGSSPEMLIRVEDGIIRTRPIAGTRPRGRNTKEDDNLARELLNDPKERAEHIMLVDLGRNDLGRVSLPGTVRITEFMEVEKYSHVIHIVSEVQGRLSPQHSALSALAASFPAGTVSGAPKIRAMEIIDELEPDLRGIYAGAVGYFSFTGNLDTCITIRTVVFHGGNAYVQAGAGIVADSDEEREYEETINKARALLATLGCNTVLS
jgi:anthranilate synthase component 1